MRRRTTGLWAALMMLVLAACSGGDATGGGTAPDGYELASGFALTADAITGLDGPTQMIVGPDGRLWVAQLNGGESDGDGQVVAVDLRVEDGEVTGTGEVEVLVEDLLKPTGIAVLDDHLWVQERRALVRYPLGGDPADIDPSGREILFEELAFNGRSEGTLAVRDDQLLWITSGTGSGTDPGETSGRMWLTDPATPAERTEYASGFKNAYSLLVLGDGDVLVGEVAEPIDGNDAPADELNVVSEGDDGGWPNCSADRVPTESLGASADDCDDTLAPIALFPPAATPTGVAAFGDAYLAALWVEGEVVSVPTAGGDPTLFLGGEELRRPQHLLVVDGLLLVNDHERGVIHVVAPA